MHDLESGVAVVVLRVEPAGEADELRAALVHARARIEPHGAAWLVRLDGEPEALHATLRGLTTRFRCMSVLRF